MPRRPSSKASPRHSKRKVSPTTSTPIGTRRPACGSGAARPSRRAMSRRSRFGSTGPTPTPRTRSQKRRDPDALPSREGRLHTSINAIIGIHTMAPRVLISDALSPAAVQIFKDRGVEVDFQPNLGKDKDKLAEIIGNYDGLAIRSATKATAKIIEKAAKLKVIGRAGIGVDNVEIP